MSDKKRTIDIIKEKRAVSEKARNLMKEFNKSKKIILNALKSESRTIPQIAEETKLPGSVVTYNLMTLMKFGVIEVDRLDDMDEYFYYRVKG